MLTNFLQLIQTRMESSRQLVTFGENISLSDSQYPHAHTEWEIKFKYAFYFSSRQNTVHEQEVCHWVPFSTFS